VASYELLDTGPEPENGGRRRLVAVLLLLVAGAALFVVVGRNHQEEVATCRQLRGATWCRTPSETLTDEAIVRLVRGYCPRLRSLLPAEVVPQPLTEVGLPAHPDEVVMRTGGSADQVESGLLGRPGRLAWVVRNLGGTDPWVLQVVCRDGTGQAPALELDGAQLDAALSADAGRGGLDLRRAALTTARAVGSGSGGRLALGTFRCRTGVAALELRVGAQFACSLQLFSDQGAAPYEVVYGVHDRPPRLRRVPRA
jgi:hypothetical protein